MLAIIVGMASRRKLIKPRLYSRLYLLRMIRCGIEALKMQV
jgi:hypothetical protein